MACATRVLIAEDNDADRLLLATIVKNHGYEVELAADGVEALAQFERFEPEMVLLDALMPGKDGFEVARHIKAQAGDKLIPVIFLTSLTRADELARCVEAGGDDFLSKPFNALILKAKLEAFDRMRELHTTLQRQRDQIAGHNAHLLQEQEAAKAVFDNVAHSGNLGAPFIKHLISPLAVFNGDVLLGTRSPTGDLYLLLGDFTGHGLTAAIGAMPLAEVFYGMAHKGFAVGDILREANRKLRYILPQGYFCCAMLVGISFAKQTVEFWNGGLPAGVMIRHGRPDVTHLNSNHLPLGILDGDAFCDTTDVLEVSPGDVLLMCTDGVVDARNAAGEAFGFDRFESLVASTPAGASPFESLRSGVYQHIGQSGRDDDITLVEVTMVTEAPLSQLPPARFGEVNPAPQDWELRYELGPQSLRNSNPLPLLQQMLMQVPQLRSRVSGVQTVLAELYSNALEHGVMRLDSRLKRSADGFARYYQQRAVAMENLDGSVAFTIRCRVDGDAGELTIRVRDSGPGFDVAALSEVNSANYHGRGLHILRELCQRLSFHGTGNEVEACFQWQADEPAR